MELSYPFRSLHELGSIVEGEEVFIQLNKDHYAQCREVFQKRKEKERETDRQRERQTERQTDRERGGE